MKLNKKINEILKYCRRKTLERKIEDDIGNGEAILKLKKGENYYFLSCLITREKEGVPTNVRGYSRSCQSWKSAKKEFKKIKSVSDFNQLYDNLNQPFIMKGLKKELAEYFVKWL